MLNENLKTLRKEKGFSQEELASKVHVVRQTVSKWEKGLSVPDAEMLVQIAEVFEVPVSRLLGALPEAAEDSAPGQRNEIAEQLMKINEQLVISYYNEEEVQIDVTQDHQVADHHFCGDPCRSNSACDACVFAAENNRYRLG